MVAVRVVSIGRSRPVQSPNFNGTFGTRAAAFRRSCEGHQRLVRRPCISPEPISTAAAAARAKVRAIRDGGSQVIEVEEVVLDDLLDLGPGDQVVADAVVAAGQAEVDESLATGESDPAVNGAGDVMITVALASRTSPPCTGASSSTDS